MPNHLHEHATEILRAEPCASRNEIVSKLSTCVQCRIEQRSAPLTRIGVKALRKAEGMERLRLHNEAQRAEALVYKEEKEKEKLAKRALLGVQRAQEAEQKKALRSKDEGYEARMEAYLRKHPLADEDKLVASCAYSTTYNAFIRAHHVRIDFLAAQKNASKNVPGLSTESITAAEYMESPPFERWATGN
jgi:hypothetical protein